ncbi:MAG: chromate efflux transporter [Crocinitomicaceae bacterium]|nr:chromate efflux transporter [Crocinitomicaceae bacterium]MDG1777346.1 chromate efflux transporter [Crocinitomicaceae bacterium]
MSKKGNIKEVAQVFFKLGVIAFGGPAAHVAMMEEEIVNKRKWMDRQHFLDLMGITNLIPGPNSTEMTMHCGHERAGIPGLFVAGFAFIFPAVVITGTLAWLYSLYGTLPNVEPWIIGIKPAVLAIIAGAVFKLGKKALKGWELGTLGLFVLAASILGVNEILALLTAGVVGAFYFSAKNKMFDNPKSILPLFLLQLPTASVAGITSLKVFWTFLKVGSVLYGSGYVLFAYLDAELVTTGWLTRQQLMDAVAVGQFTPGPVLSTATFVGYQLTGFWGAVGATLGIFLPSFLFVLILNPLVPRMRKSKVLGFFLDSVNIAAVAVMAGVLFEMAKISLVNWQGIVIAVISFALIFGFKKVSSMWIVLGGSLLGFLFSLM